MFKARYLVSGACVLAVAAGASSALAQAAAGGAAVNAVPPMAAAPPATTAPPVDQSAGGSGAGDIIVTAQRRAERLQDVPIAVSAITSTALADAGIKNTLDLRIAVPTLYVQQGNGYLYLKLRGVGADASGPGLENSVASYVDGVYLGSQAGAAQSYGDIERVEVLKGPQGTLFGRNATGGLVQIVTRDPQQQFAGNAEAGYGNYNTFSSKGYVTGGITKWAELGVSYFVNTQGDGWGKNLYNGDDVYRLNHEYGFRGKLVLHAGDFTKITIGADYSNTAGSIIAASLLQGSTSAFLRQVVTYPSDYDTNVNHTQFIRAHGGGVSGKIEQDLGFANLVSISAYRRYKSDRTLDLDLSPLPIGWFPAVNQFDKQFSQEVQLLSKRGGLLNWTVGAYYYNATGYYEPFERIFETAGVTDTVNSRVKTISYSGYGQGTYAFGPTTNLTLGVRYTTERKSLTGTEAVSAGGSPFIGTDSADDRRVTANKVTFRASLDQHLSQDIMAYASFNRGFKSGGWNPSLLSSAPFKPETLDAYEGGLKTQLFDKRLTLNVAGFYYNYENIQISTFGPDISIIIANGPKARIYGLDTDFNARVTRDFNISGGFQLISAKFRKYGNCIIGNTLGNPVVAGDCSGNQLPGDSKFNSSLSPRYTFRLANNGKVEVSTTWYHNSGFYTAADNAIRQPAFDEVGANVRWTNASEHLSFAVWGKNLNDNHSINISAELPTGDNYTQYNAPRTYGFTLGYKF